MAIWPVAEVESCHVGLWQFISQVSSHPVCPSPGFHVPAWSCITTMPSVTFTAICFISVNHSSDYSLLLGFMHRSMWIPRGRTAGRPGDFWHWKVVRIPCMSKVCILRNTLTRSVTLGMECPISHCQNPLVCPLHLPWRIKLTDALQMAVRGPVYLFWGTVFIFISCKKFIGILFAQHVASHVIWKSGNHVQRK